MGATNVLIVEDEPDIAELLVFLMTHQGCRTKHAPNGLIALQHLADDLPDLVETDMAMPVMDGSFLIETMRASSRLRKVPILVLSSMSEGTVRDICGAPFIYLQKPFRVAQLSDSVETLLAGKSLIAVNPIPLS